MLELLQQLILDDTSVTDVVGSDVVTNYDTPEAVVPAVLMTTYSASTLSSSDRASDVLHYQIKLYAMQNGVGAADSLGKKVRAAVDGRTGSFVADDGVTYDLLSLRVNDYDIRTDYTGTIASIEMDVVMNVIVDADVDTSATDMQNILKHFRYDEPTDKLVADRAIETTLNSLFLGEQHKMSSGAENIFFTNLGNETNFFPLWGGLKDQSITANQGADGFIPPSGRVYTDMFSLPLGGNPDPATSIGYTGENYFGVSIAGLGITTVAAEEVNLNEVKLTYMLSVNDRNVYKQVLPTNAVRESGMIYAGDQIEWFFDHPVEIHAGTTIFAEITKVSKTDDTNQGIFQVRQGDTVDPNTGLYRYQAIVHNRLFEDKDIELISPYLKYQAMDFSVDPTGATVIMKDLTLPAGEQVLSHEPINGLVAVADGTQIQIKVKDGAKVIMESVPVSGMSINGSLVNSVLNNAVVELNELFTVGASFSNSAGNPVSGFALSGDDLTITLTDGTSFTQDVTSFGVDTNNFVTSGEVSGSDLILTMSDASTVTIDATNLVNGSTSSATGSDWLISYGTYANQSVNSTTAHLDNNRTPPVVGGKAPFYFGTELARGTEFRWNNNPNQEHMFGIWDGTEAEAGTYNSRIHDYNWSTGFKYPNSNGYVASSNTSLTNTTGNNAYAPSFGAPLALRFLNDGHVVLVDLSGATEVEIAKTNNALVVDSFPLQLGCDANFVFPQFVVTDTASTWDIAHDYAGTESGILNGILDHTVLKSNISIEMGEKIMFMLDEVGQGDFFGTGYTNASTGIATAEEQLDNQFKYETNEALDFEISGVSDWNVNTNSTHYFNNGAGVVGYREGGAGTIQGMFSLRFNSDGKLTIYSEDNNEKVATAKMDPAVGSSVHLYFGVRGNRAYYSIPVISKQTIGGGSQPIQSYAPTVADQTVSVTEAAALNFAVVSSDNVVNQYVETDAPSWMFMNQTTGVLSGTAPAYTGTGADTIVVNCKAGNAVGGTTSFTVTVTIDEDTSYTNSNSLEFNGTSAFLQGNATLMNAMDRASNGDGNAWSLSMWIKPNNNTAVQTLFNYGAGDDYNGGAITIKKINTNTLAVNYGTVYNNIITLANVLNHSQWSHILITFDGGTTGNDPNDVADYYSRFKVYLNGFQASTVGVNSNQGYTGVISGANVSDNIFRIGRANNIHNNYFDGIINQVGIWSSDESANASTIYNSGATQDLSLLSSAPDHYYEIDTSVTTVTDLTGSVDFTGYNFTGTDLVTDTP